MHGCIEYVGEGEGWSVVLGSIRYMVRRWRYVGIGAAAVAVAVGSVGSAAVAVVVVVVCSEARAAASPLSHHVAQLASLCTLPPAAKVCISV